MDTPTLLIVFLLVSAASLASYALSQWSWIRGGNRGLGWAATSMGTTLLLAAAAIVVITLVVRATFWQPDSGAEQQLREPAASTDKRSARSVDGSKLPTAATSESAAPANRTARSLDERHASDVRAAPRGANEQPSRPGSQQSADQSKTAGGSVPHLSGPVFAEDNPWAATKCVHVFNPDLGDPTRWKVENECEAPVGVIVSSCGANPLDCSDRDEMIFPMKAQRPVTHDEQTLYRQQIRYVACFVTTPLAIQLIGESSEVRSSPSWREQFDAVRLTDGCLLRVQNWPGEGRR